MDEFAIGSLCIIVVAVDLNQADACPHAIHIVVQASVLFHNAVPDFRLFRIRIGVGIGVGIGVRVGSRLGFRFRFRIRCGIHGRRIDHLAGLIERIFSSRKQAVGQRYPICTAMDEFAIGSLCIIVVAVDLNQADSCPHAIHIVVQASALFHNAVLDFWVGTGVGGRLGFRFRIRIRIRCGIHGRRIDHLAGLIERILSDRKQAVGQGDPIGSALYRCTGTGAEIVVVPVQQNQAGSLYQITVFDQISVAVFLCI